MGKLQSSFEENENLIGVKFYNNNFKEGSTFARLTRNTVQPENLAAMLKNMGNLHTEEALYGIFTELKGAILKALASGYAVNLFDIGTVYPKVKGGMDISSPALSDLPELTVGFSASEEAKNAAAKATVTTVLLADDDSEITEIRDCFTQATDGTLTSSRSARIKGKRIKIAGDETAGIYFVPLLENGKGSTDETTWVMAESSTLSRNTAGCLEFTLPDTLETGNKYYIAIKTASSANSKTLNKTYRTVYSEQTVSII